MSLYSSPVNTEIIIGNDSNPSILQNTEVIIVYNGYQLCKKIIFKPMFLRYLSFQKWNSVFLNSKINFHEQYLTLKKNLKID